MGKIKTRETVKNIKALDKAAVAGERMKDAYIRTRNQAQNLSDDGKVSSSEYAADNLQYAMEDIASDMGHAVSSGAKKAVSKGKEAYQHHRAQKSTDGPTNTGADPDGADSPVGSGHAPGKASTQTRSYQQGRKLAQEQSRNRSEIKIRGRNVQSIKTAPKAEKTIKQTAKSGGKTTIKTAKGSVKTTQKTIKTAEQTSKVAIKTTERTAAAAKQSAIAAAKASQKAMQIARATAKATVVAAKAAAKAVAAAVKAIIAGAKALAAAIAAGGWVAVIVVVVICLIGLIVASCFGIFFSSEDTGSEKTMQMVVREINDDYLAKLDDIKAIVDYDVLEMSGSRAVWPEVLAIYAVKTTTDPDNPQEVATMTEEKQQLLEDIFWAMNEIDYETDTKTETEIVESDDGNGNIVEEEVSVTQTYLYITVGHKTADEMAEEYNFTEDQKEQLAELLADENASLWTAVLYGISSTDEQIVAVALSQIGNVGGYPYWSWYGFGSRVEWCACFVSWCANECGYIENGIIPKFAGCVNGVQWFRDRGQWADNSATPTPGMIIFFDWDSPNGSSGPQDGQSDHVGIVEKVEDGRVYTIEGNSGDSCRQRSYPLGYYEILGYGIPAY